MTTSSTVNPIIDRNASNLKQEWDRFEQHVKLMFMGPMKKCDASEKAAFRLIWVGAAGREIYIFCILSDADSSQFDILITNFKNTLVQKRTLCLIDIYFMNDDKKRVISLIILLLN